MTTHEQLQQAMEFYHVIEVHADGTISDAPSDLRAPESVRDDEVDSRLAWTLMDGYSGQYGYSGPTMHESEYIGGRLADDILARPGYYVATLSFDTCPPDHGEDCEDDIAGWAIAYLPSHEVVEVDMSEVTGGRVSNSADHVT